MSTPEKAIPFPQGQGIEGLKNLLGLLKAGSPSAAAPSPVSGDQIAAELAYKLGQASAKANDQMLFQQGVLGLLEAFERLNKALSGEK